MPLGPPYSFALNCHSSTNGVPTILEGFLDYQNGQSSKSIVLRSENLQDMVRWINNINSLSSSNNGDGSAIQVSQQESSLSSGSDQREHLSFSASNSSYLSAAARSTDRCNTTYSSSRSSTSPNKTLTLEQLSPNTTPTNSTPPAAAPHTPLSRDASQRSLVSSLRCVFHDI